MDDQILISVIIPVFNAGNLVDICVQSILDQTYQNFEIILVNDGSKDNSLQICRDWSAKDDRITTLDQLNQGAGIARNTGFAAAKGEYIYFLDADDFITSTLLRRTLLEVQDYKYDIVLFGFNKIAPGGKQIAVVQHQGHELKNVSQQKEILVSLFLDGGCFAVWDKIFRREFLIGTNIKFDGKKRGQDLTFMIKCYKQIHSLKSISDVLHNYNVAYNTSHKYDQQIIENHLENYSSLFSFLNNSDGATDSNSQRYLKRMLVLWFGLVIPMNIVNAKEMSSRDKRLYLNTLLSNNEFEIWMKYLKSVKLSAKNEVIFKILSTQNTAIVIPFIKVLSYLRKKFNLTF